jgi:glycosyltransferase involved in cell wall biosynthesis
MNPPVSIGLPVRNGRTYLGQAVDSILAQTYENFELVVSDNASTDRTEPICRAYAARGRAK